MKVWPKNFEVTLKRHGKVILPKSCQENNLESRKYSTILKPVEKTGVCLILALSSTIQQ